MKIFTFILIHFLLFREQESVKQYVFQNPVITAESKKEIEAAVLEELNLARKDPKDYAIKYLQPRLKDFEGKKYKKSITREGAAVVEECISEMKSTAGMQQLQIDPRLNTLAAQYTKLQGKTQEVGHETGSKSFKQRVESVVNDGFDVGEVISYNAFTAREIVIQLLVDDGVRNRGHRRHILQKKFSNAGIAFGSHGKYPCMCTIIFSGKAIEEK